MEVSFFMKIQTFLFLSESYSPAENIILERKHFNFPSTKRISVHLSQNFKGWLNQYLPDQNLPDLLEIKQEKNFKYRFENWRLHFPQ